MSVAAARRRATKKKGRKVLATAKRPTKVAITRPSKNGKAKPSSNGAALKSAGKKKFADNQPPPASMEDVDERIPALEEVCSVVLAAKKSATASREEADQGLAKIGELLIEHERTHYIVGDKKFVPVAGAATVKILKVKN